MRGFSIFTPERKMHAAAKFKGVVSHTWIQSCAIQWGLIIVDRELWRRIPNSGQPNNVPVVRAGLDGQSFQPGLTTVHAQIEPAVLARHSS